MSIRCLTLTQPWAQLVAVGAKRIETRHWRTSYRGPLLIHAALRFPTDCKALCSEEPFHWWLDHGGYEGWDELPRGEIVAIANLTGCESTTIVADRLRRTIPPDLDELAFGDYSAGRFAWVLADIRRLPTPIPCRGFQQLWVPTAEVLEQVRAQLGEAVASGSSQR